MSLKLRPIVPADNPFVESLVKTVLEEHGLIGPGWASGDAELKDMYATYQAAGSGYWVVEDTETGKVLGGGGFGRLKGTTEAENICELQKIYFAPEARGKGLGKQLLQLIIDEAAQAGYGTMYLESAPQLERAVGLYTQLGFERISCHLGDTGHQARCSLYMTRPLTKQTTLQPA
jgi:putative acetyltransferase